MQHKWLKLKKINPEETHFSDCFKNIYYAGNHDKCHQCKGMVFKICQDRKHIAKHFVALSTNEKEVVKFGIDRSNMFGSGIGLEEDIPYGAQSVLSIALTIGYEISKNCLQGAHESDKHFQEYIF